MLFALIIVCLCFYATGCIIMYLLPEILDDLAHVIADVIISCRRTKRKIKKIYRILTH